MKRKLFLPILLIISVVMSLFFVVGVLAEDDTPTLELSGANLVFTERVHILYAVDIKNADADKVELLIFRGADTTASSCVKGNEQKVLYTTGAKVEDSKVKGFVFEYTDLAAAEMTENIYARAYYTDGENEYYSETVKYSVLQYACNKLGITGTATENVKLKNMLTNMLLYGASAQEYFEVNTDRLATDTYVKYYFEDATLDDGLSYGLFKKGETFNVTSTKVDENNPYAVWSNENGASMAVGATVQMTADKNRVVSSAAQATEPTFGSYKYVVIVGVDGAGCFYPEETDTPNIDRIFANGAVTHENRVTSPTASSISWMSCLHGVLPENHGNTENMQVEEGPEYSMDSKYPSILRVVKEARPDREVACLYAWIGINGIVENADEIDINKIKMGDAAIVNYLESGYLESNKPALTYLHFNNPDSVGHNVGHLTPEYYASIETIDEYVGRIYAAYEKAGMIEDTLFIVTADHGGVNQTHGGLLDQEKFVLFAAAGKNVTNTEIQDMYIRDTAAITLHALGVEMPETYTAHVPTGVFADVEAGERREYHDPDLPRYRVPEATPANGTVNNFVDNTLAVYLPFDGNTNELVNNSVVDEIGKITYQDGYFGKGVQLEDGHLNVHANFTPGTGSFTISTWAKFATPTNGSSPMIATKAWGNGTAGFAFATGRYASVERQDHYGALAFANGSTRVAYSGGASCPELAFPNDYIYGWMHVLITVDKDAGLIKVSYDFNESYVVDMPASIMNGNLNSVVDYITLGNDTTGAASAKSGVAFDEFMIFYGALDTADVAGLKEYYGVDSSSSAPTDDETIGDILDADIYFEFDGFTKNDGSLDSDVSKYGSLEYGEGIDGEAVYLDGTDFFTVDDIKFGTDSFTFATWIKPTDLKFNSGAYRLPIFSTAGTDSRDNTLGFDIILDTEYGNLTVIIANENAKLGLQEMYRVFCPSGYMDSPNFNHKPAYTEFENKWMHIAVTVDRDNNLLLIYLNFEKVMEVPLNYYNSSKPIPDDLSVDNYPLTVGQYGVQKSHTPDMYMDDLMIFKRTLTAAEIAKMEKYYRDPLSDYIDKAPVLDLSFDGSIENLGSYAGAIEEEGTLTYGDGYFGSAGRFDDASVDLPELELGKSDLTFAFWFNTEEVNYKVDGKTTGYTYTSNIFSTAYRANSDYQGIQVMYNREINSIFVQTNNQYKSARGYLWASVKDIAKNNEWMHVTVVINTTPAAGQDYVEIYVNFEKLPLASVTSPAYFGQNTFDGGEGFTPHIGADGQGYVGNYTPRGYIDEFLMFDSALTADEIAKLGEYYNQ